jgi:hypothetical protein
MFSEQGRVSHVLRCVNKTGWGLIACIAMIAPCSSHAEDALKSTTYTVLVIDMNGDGLDDFFLQAQVKIILVPLDDDLAFPIVQPAPAPSFILLSIPTGSYKLVPSSTPAPPANQGWHAAGYLAAPGDGSVAPAGSLYIHSAAPSRPYFIVGDDAAGTLNLVQQGGTPVLQNAVQYLGQDVPPNMAGGTRYHMTVTVKNTGSTTWPADGSYHLRFQGAGGASWTRGIVQADLLTVRRRVGPGESYGFGFDVKAPGGSYNLAFEIVDGENIPFGTSPAASVSVAIPSLDLTWANFVSTLNSNNKSESLSYFADQARFGAVLNALDGKLAMLGGSLSEPYFIVMEPTFASAIVQQTYNGTTMRHYVNFALINGLWLITSF